MDIYNRIFCTLGYLINIGKLGKRCLINELQKLDEN